MKVLLFDFDSTIFFLFKNYDRKKIIEELNKTLKKYGIFQEVDRNFFNSFIVAKGNKECLKEINDLITKAELEAIDSGYNLLGLEDVFPKLLKKYRIGIVSNNSKECIDKYMEKYWNKLDLPFFGRIPLRPDLLKPNPYLLEEAYKYFKCDKKDILYIGDNVTDYLAAEALNISFIGMAYLDKKMDAFLRLEKDFPIVRNYYELEGLL